VSHGYDAPDGLISITLGSTVATIALDALGRMRTRTASGNATTYGSS
jgi:hypothetical protein